MMTVNAVSRLSGVSIRTLQYYDRIGLLKATDRTEAGYRLYDGTALERLQQILLFRELEFPLREIARILDSPNFDQKKALQQQIELLTLKKEQIERLILLACSIIESGGNAMDFSAFDSAKRKEYAKQARETWGRTDAYKEFEAKHGKWDDISEQSSAQGLMQIFGEFAQYREASPDSAAVQALVGKLQRYITEHYYTCTDAILAGLGEIYAAGGDFTKNIDGAAGAGTAEFVHRAIRIFTKK